MNNIDTIVDTFKNILDIPAYYIFQSNYNSDTVGIFDFYGHINNIKIYIITCNVSVNFMKSDHLINSSILITDGDISYKLLLPIDDFTLLVINDIIKSFGGVIL